MRFKFHRSVLIVQCIVVCMLVVCAPGLSESSSPKNLKDFTAFSFIDNQEINTAEMRGKILVLVFGSIYCKPCVELLPVMDELNERYKNSDVRILLLDIDMAVDPELQREFVGRHAIKSPYIINALPIARDNKVYMLPTTLIVDREGEVLTRIYGFKKIKKFDKVIKKQRPIFAVFEPEPQQGHHKDHQKPYSAVELDNASVLDNATVPDNATALDNATEPDNASAAANLEGN
jgi:thiol-disulfide isomerase/thioredoxin